MHVSIRSNLTMPVAATYRSKLSEDVMAYTIHELKEKTVQDLREIAKGVEDQEVVKGFSQMNKDHLLPVLAKALGIHEHHDVVGIDKASIKSKMRDLRT